ncbi:MAG: SDR family NAD(P)-dependent oxidoreductase [Candidatus Hodarchaeota archaeon]
MGKLKDKVALITGVGEGIGEATAMLFAEEGANLVCVDINKKTGKKVVESIQEMGGSAVFVKADVSKVSDIKSAIEVTREKGGLDVLFNNAGIEVAKGILETTEEEWNHSVDVNLKSVFMFCKLAIPEMETKGGGSIINNSSAAGLVGSFSPAYSAAKGGIIALTKALAVDFGPKNIRVNCICPGAIETPMLQRVIQRQGDPTEVRERRTANYPLGRFGSAEEVANTALFLASDDSSFITGAVIVVDGGFTSK